MALSLSAEQKCLNDIFAGNDLYVIPSYQRAYSWEYEQCIKLYSDLMDAFEDNRDYFLGNIIIARSKRNVHHPEVVDGQQRLISIWLIFKALSVIFPDLPVLENKTKVASWDGLTNYIKIRSDVFESNDNDWIKEVASWKLETYNQLLENVVANGDKISPRYFKTNIKTNSVQFFYWFKDFCSRAGIDQLRMFVKWLLEEVYMLPIELSAEEQIEANAKALTIFETINNRGLDLCDADIFKAKLYSKTINDDEKKEFIDLWVDFKNTTSGLGMSIDEVFRIYMHIARGYAGKIGTEKSLRDFFTGEYDSPLNKKGYREVLQDLMDILSIVQQVREQRFEENETGAFLQLIDYYSNQYPGYAVIVFAFHNKGIDSSNENHVRFLKSIVRYCYYLGSTTSVKFEIYNIIQQICSGKQISDYYVKVEPEYFNYLGRLKYNYALLVHYIKHPTGLTKWTIDKMLTGKDANNLPEDWTGHDFYKHVDDLGNFIVIDKAKKSAPYPNKRLLYMKSSIWDSAVFLQNHEVITFKEITARSIEMKKTLVSFFNNPTENE